MPWKRDPGVAAMVEYLDKDPRLLGSMSQQEWALLPTGEKFERLSTAHRKAIIEQAALCREDFSYAARNYFWIVNKKKQDQLFSLWESQHLILEKYYELKAKGRAQKLLILKARQLGASLVVEAMIAWRSMFFRNTNALVVSVDQGHSQYMFSLMMHIYEKMPWWLQPEAASLKYEEGLWFATKDREVRKVRPGLNSHVSVQHASQISGVGQGTRLDAVHVSEISDFSPSKAEEIIEGDLLYAIANDPECFGFLESTAKQAGDYWHRLWRTNKKLGDEARWYPLFLPWFFETTRFLPPPRGWSAKSQEEGMRERVAKEWVRCDNAECRQYHEAFQHGEHRQEATCPSCGRGVLHPVILEDGQLYWKEVERVNAEGSGITAHKKHLAEMTTTAEQSFQIAGYAVFDEECDAWVESTVEPPKFSGFIDRRGEFHAVAGRDKWDRRFCRVQGCTADHAWDDETFVVWEMPLDGFEYAVGVDVSEGIGQDYSVIFVNKLGRHGAPDEQVALWRDNHTNPKELAFYCNVIGRMYNNALMCIEYNTYQTTGDDVLYLYQYTNIFRWKHKDSTNPLSNKWHWWSKYGTKHLLWHTARHWLRAKMWAVRSENFQAEMKTFQKDEADDNQASHARGFHDDELMAGFISLYCPHEMDTDIRTGYIPAPQRAIEQGPLDWAWVCQSCGHLFDGGRPEEEYRCPKCHSIRLEGKPKGDEPSRGGREYCEDLFSKMGQPIPGGLVPPGKLSYDQL